MVELVTVGGLTQTLVGVVGRGSPPRPVVVERLADAAVVSLRVVFAVADQPSRLLHTLAGVAVTLAPEDTPAPSAQLHRCAAPLRLRSSSACCNRTTA